MNHPAFVRRVLALVLTAAVAVAAALPGFAVYAMPIQTAYPQESIYLFDADTGEALVEQNPDMVRHVASLTKMMTALLVIENGSDLNASITIPDRLTPEFQSIKANRGHTIGLQAGESVRRIDMLYAMLLPSANDAASVLASDAAGGDLAAFAARMNARARVPKLEFNDYAYRDIALDGRFENRRFTGKIASDDPNMTFDFDGDLDFNGEQPVYHFDLNLVNADLHELHFNRRDTVSRVRCGLHAQASGTSLDNINGEAEIFDMTYVNQLDTVRTGRIRLLAENGSDRKLIGLYSPFADAELRGKLSYENMFSYFSNTLRSYLPSLSERPRTAEDSVPSVAGASRIDSYYLLDVNVKRANNVAGIFSPGLRLAQGTKLVFLFNPESDVFSLTLDSELIENERFFVSDLKSSCRNQGDSISLFVTAADLFAKGMYMPDFSVIGGAKEPAQRIRTNISKNSAPSVFLCCFRVRRMRRSMRSRSCGENTIATPPRARLHFYVNSPR